MTQSIPPREGAARWPGDDPRRWFLGAKLGLFLHWGLYAIPGWHEQDQQRRGIPRETYARLARRFSARRFDARSWARFARESGADYLVLTAKHHDGFCLWHTRTTAFHVGATPLGRDVVAEVAGACAAEGLPFGVYLSVVDWHQPSYPNLGRHHELPGPLPGDRPDWAAYREVLGRQVEELAGGRYGKLACFWWDMNVPEAHDPSLNARIRELQPGCVINNRGLDAGDFSTPERHWDEDARRHEPYAGLVEACESVGALSWGWKRDDDLFTARHLQSRVATYLARGGRFLLNLGPRADGTLDPRQRRRFEAVGRWLSATREAFEDTEPCTGLLDTPGVLATRRADTLWLILVDTPTRDGLQLSPLRAAPARAISLLDGRPIRARLDKVPFESHLPHGHLRLERLPIDRWVDTVPVIRLDFRPGDLPRERPAAEGTAREG